MKILYIDNNKYGHNSDLHIQFFQYMEKKKYHHIYGYGEHMGMYFNKARIPDKKNPKKDLNRILKEFNPDIILSYNCNGSSYEIGLDNPSQFAWLTSTLAKIDLPKFHITTDYCRSGFREEQAQWFSDINCTGAMFRHKIALDHPIKVPSFWLPFSIDKRLYQKNIQRNIARKEQKVGFIGAAHNSAVSLYANRIAAFDYLQDKGLLATTKLTSEKKQRRQMLFGLRYVRFLSSNMFGLTCGGTCDFMTAKYFQIPAAYSMLVCSQTSGLEIFPKDTYILFDKNNLGKLESDIREHISNYQLVKDKTRVLHNYVINSHNHDLRIKQFTKRVLKLI